jgi:chromo domain-containing protein 1
VFPVERILAENCEDDKIYFLVFWSGYPEQESTWEPQKNMDPEILQAWEVRKRLEAMGLLPPFPLAEFNARLQELAWAKEDRRRRRKIKRNGLGIPVSIPAATTSSTTRRDSESYPTSTTRD